MSADIRWIRSYVVREEDGSPGTVCIYQARRPSTLPARSSFGETGHGAIRGPSTTGKLFRIDDVGGRGVTERAETGIELLLSEPEIVAWLEPYENKDDDDDEPPRAA